jgi:Fibronectin type III domain
MISYVTFATPGRFISALALLIFFAVGPVEAATVTLQWDPNPETNVAGYVVSYGTSSGQYGATVDVGNQLSFQFSEPTQAAIYYFAVRAYNTDGVQGPFSAEVNTAALIPALTLTGISSSLSAPQAPGTAVTFTAGATGGVAPYKYKWLASNGSAWSVGQDWSASSTFAWTPSAANANDRVGVWVRSATNVTDAPDSASAAGDIAYAIVAPPAAPVPPPPVTTAPVTIAPVTLATNLQAPSYTETTIQFVATVGTTASGAGEYQFKWWVFDGVTWAVAQEWSTVNRFNWYPRISNAQYQVLVRAQKIQDATISGGTSEPFAIAGR